MKRTRITFVVSIFVIVLLLGAGYYFWKDIDRVSSDFLRRLRPCGSPITYSIGNLDPRFGLTKEKLLGYTQQAEKIWEASINKPLFEYSPTGKLKINFVYDYRQKATDALRKMGIALKDDQSTYDVLKAKYTLLVDSYIQKKAQIDVLIKRYDGEKSAFEKEVNYWNSRGGAPKVTYTLLERKRADLNKQVAVLNQKKDSLNMLIDTIHSAEIVLNQLIVTLNLKVGAYNTVSASTGEEFSEGVYMNDANGIAIVIFQFNDTDKLMKVLTHELGHALGLGHLDNPKAVMYRLNEGMNDMLTTDDLTALKKVCGIN